jgi:hypothetical protein
MTIYSLDEATALRGPFLDHNQATGMPESFPGLVFTRPDEDLQTAKFVIITPFSIDRKHRPAGSGAIPCSLCSNESGKYLEGRLVWFEDGQIRLIGHLCATTLLGKTRVKDALASFKAQAALLADEGYLARALPRLAAIRDEIEALRRTASSVQRAKSDVERAAPTLMRLLRRMDKSNRGDLFVDFMKPRDSTVFSRENSPERVSFGRLDGRKFLSSTFFPLERLNALIADFEDLNLGDGTDAVEAFVRYGGTIPHLAKRLRKLVRDTLGLQADVDDSLGFMRRANLARLRAWFIHPATMVSGNLVLDSIRARVRDDGKAFANLPFSDSEQIPPLETVKSLIA